MAVKRRLGVRGCQ